MSEGWIMVPKGGLRGLGTGSSEWVGVVSEASEVVEDLGDEVRDVGEGNGGSEFVMVAM